MVKNLPAMEETWDRSLGRDDSLEKGMATYSDFLPGESLGQRSLAGYSTEGHKESDMTECYVPDARNELESQKFVNRMWFDSHSVLTCILLSETPPVECYS